jgi:hypothetical protein
MNKIGVVILLGAMGFFIAWTSHPTERDPLTAVQPVEQAPWTNVLAPAQAESGVIEITIPPGTGAQLDSGNLAAITLPAVMYVRVGDKIIIHNHDVRPHLLLYAYIEPGGTNVRQLDAPGTEVYSAGCSSSAATSGLFMTMAIEP